MNRYYTSVAHKAQKEIFVRSAKKRHVRNNEPGTEGSFLAAVYHRNQRLAKVNNSLDSQNTHLKNLLVRAEGIAAEKKLYLDNLLAFLGNHSGNEIIHRVFQGKLDVFIAVRQCDQVMDFNIFVPLISKKAIGALQLQVNADCCTIVEITVKKSYRKMQLDSTLLAVAEARSKMLFQTPFRIGGDYCIADVGGADIFFEKAGYSVWLYEQGLKFSKTIIV